MHVAEFEAWRRTADLLGCRLIFDRVFRHLTETGMDVNHARDTVADYVRGFTISRLREFGYGYVQVTKTDNSDIGLGATWSFFTGKSEKLGIRRAISVSDQTEALAYEAGIAQWERKRRSGGGRYAPLPPAPETDGRQPESPTE